MHTNARACEYSPHDGSGITLTFTRLINVCCPLVLRFKSGQQPDNNRTTTVQKNKKNTLRVVLLVLKKIVYLQP